MKYINNEMIGNVDVIECKLKAYDIPTYWKEFNIVNHNKLYRVGPLQNYITDDEYLNYCENDILYLNNDMINVDILHSVAFSTNESSKTITFKFDFVRAEYSKDLEDILVDELTPCLKADMNILLDMFLKDCIKTSRKISTTFVDGCLRVFYDYDIIKEEEK